MRRNRVTILRVGLWLKNEGSTPPPCQYRPITHDNIQFMLNLTYYHRRPCSSDPRSHTTHIYFISAFVRQYKGAHSLHRILVHILSYLASHRRLSRSLSSSLPSYLRKWMSNESCRINKITNSALSRKQVILPLFCLFHSLERCRSALRAHKSRN